MTGFSESCGLLPGFGQGFLCGVCTPTIIWELTFLLQMRNLGVGAECLAKAGIKESPSLQVPLLPASLLVHALRSQKSHRVLVYMSLAPLPGVAWADQWSLGLRSSF